MLGAPDGSRHVRKKWVSVAGIAAMMAGIIGLIVAPLHALAYFATGEPAGLLPWREPGHSALRPLLEWSSPDVVYSTYGKISLLVIGGFTAGLFALRAQRVTHARGVERWGLRVATIGYPLLLLGLFVEYWTPFLELGFRALTLPGLLLTLVGSTLIGVGHLRARQVPRVAAWLLSLSVPAVLATVAAIGHIIAGLAVLDVAWILIGMRLAMRRGRRGARG
jgi:hypothetical protein